MSSQYNYYDDGTILYIDFDLNNAVSWYRRDVKLDAFGRQTEQTNYNDNGTYEMYTLDASHTASWSMVRENRNSSLQLFSQVITWDDGSYSNYEFNPTNGSLVSVTNYDRNGRVVRPIVLDLNGDGYFDLRPSDLTNELAPAAFDWDGDGVADPTAWVGALDGFLVIDLSAEGDPGPDGVIDQAMELAFSAWPNAEITGGDISDLEGLRIVFDTNRDNILDSQDARWSEFRVWQDLNQNGVSETGELKTMSEAGLRLFNLLPTTAGAMAFADGSAISGTSSYETTDGLTHLAADAMFSFTSSRLGIGA